jgi:EmrB/QacA subfamily drug resistance transporter
VRDQPHLPLRPQIGQLRSHELNRNARRDFDRLDPLLESDELDRAVAEPVEDRLEDSPLRRRRAFDLDRRHLVYFPAVDRKWWTLIAVCVAIFMLLLDITIVNVALPSIERSLDASFSDLQWVVDAYALALATCVLTAGSVADLVGRKRVFVAGIVVFTAASALCGAANDPLFLILARAAQGIGGAIMFATSLALLSQEFHGRERGTAFGIWGATTGAAVAIGPLAGGMLTSWLSWRWIFLVNVPIGIAEVFVSTAQLRESSDPEHGSIDASGLLTLTGGLFTLVLALIEGNGHGWTSAYIVALFAVAAVALITFVALQARRPQSMIDLALFRKPAFAGAQIAAFALSASMFSMFLYLTLYLQNILGYSPLQAGLRFLVVSGLAFATAPLAGKLSAYAPVRLLLGGGLGLIAAGLLLMHGLTPDSAWTALVAGFVVGGIGIGLTNPPLASTAISTVRQERAGMASGVNSTFRQVGIATGIAALGAVFQHQVATKIASSLPGVANAHDLGRAVATGQAAAAFRSVPPGLRRQLGAAARAAFVSGLNEILLIGACVAAVGAVLALALVRRRDFVQRAAPGG